MLPIIQLATECYLKSILATLLGTQDLSVIYGKAEVPHNLKFLYNDIFNKVPQQNNPLQYSCSLRNRLSGLFGDYNNTRFPNEEYNIILTGEDLDIDFDIMTEIKQLALQYEQMYQKKLESEKEQEELLL